jgi:hypothetical protein
MSVLYVYLSGVTPPCFMESTSASTSFHGTDILGVYMEHDVVRHECRPHAATRHAVEHHDRVPEPAGAGERGHERRVCAGVGLQRGGLREAPGARENADGGREHARVVEGGLAVDVPRGVERGADVPAGGERVHEGAERGRGDRGEEVPQGGVVRVGEEGEERAAGGEGEGRRQVPGLSASTATAGGV